jgi:hypothetical protein
LKDISTRDFSTPSFNPRPFNPELFNHELSNPRIFNPRLFNHGYCNQPKTQFKGINLGIFSTTIGPLKPNLLPVVEDFYIVFQKYILEPPKMGGGGGMDVAQPIFLPESSENGHFRAKNCIAIKIVSDFHKYS